MNEQTLKLLEQLATKLGTTADNIWVILIAQAKVNFAIDCLYFLITGILLFLNYRYLAKWVQEWDRAGEPAETIYCVSVLSLLVLTAISVIISITLIPDAVNSLFNPQYWALQQVLSSIK